MPQLLYNAAASESAISVSRIHSPVCTKAHLQTLRTLLNVTGESIWMHRNYFVWHQSQAASVWRDSILRTTHTSNFPIWGCMLTSSLGIKSLGNKVTFCDWHHWHFLNRLKSENIILSTNFIFEEIKRTKEEVFWYTHPLQILKKGLHNTPCCSQMDTGTMNARLTCSSVSEVQQIKCKCDRRIENQCSSVRHKQQSSKGMLYQWSLDFHKYTSSFLDD